MANSRWKNVIDKDIAWMGTFNRILSIAMKLLLGEISKSYGFSLGKDIFASCCVAISSKYIFRSFINTTTPLATALSGILGEIFMHFWEYP